MKKLGGEREEEREKNRAGPGWLNRETPVERAGSDNEGSAV